MRAAEGGANAMEGEGGVTWPGPANHSPVMDAGAGLGDARLYLLWQSSLQTFQPWLTVATNSLLNNFFGFTDRVQLVDPPMLQNK